MLMLKFRYCFFRSINEFLFIDFAKVHTQFLPLLLLLTWSRVYFCASAAGLHFSHLKRYANFDEALVLNQNNNTTTNNNNQKIWSKASTAKINRKFS